jgi:AcrR family transcriptional regulator
MTTKHQAATPTTLKPTGTRERIIQRSIALFNKRGLQHVAIDHIATDLKISPGNLTYHFKRKRDLILATAAQGARTIHHRHIGRRVRRLPDIDFPHLLGFPFLF